MFRIPIALFTLSLPAALHAECPVAGDLDKGIAFTGTHDEREVFTDLGGGLVSSSYRTPDGYATEAILLHGVYLIEFLNLVGTENETRTSYEFPMDNNEIRPPGVGGSWEVLVSATDGNNNVFERQFYTFGTLEQQSYGACAYDVIPYTAEYSTAPDSIETYHYLPELGLSYLYQHSDPTGEGTHPYTAIETVP